MSDIDYMEHLRLEVERPLEAGEKGNLIANPSGDLGAWGWGTPYGGQNLVSVEVAGERALRFEVELSNTFGHVTSEPATVLPGKYVAARFDLVESNNLAVAVRFSFEDADGAVISSTTATTATSTPGTYFIPAALAPAGTAKVTLRFDIDRVTSSEAVQPGDYLTFRRAMMVAVDDPSEMGTTRTNLIKNPSFEVDITGWQAIYGAPRLARSMAQGSVSGTYAMRMMAAAGNSVPTNLTAYVQHSDRMPVVGGQDYTVAGSVLQNVGTTTYEARLTIWWLDAMENLIEVPTAAKIQTQVGVWQRFSATRTAPSNATHAQVLLTIMGADDDTTRFYWDAISFEQGAGGDYFDGSTTGDPSATYSWTGTAHYSSSTASVASTSYPYEEPVKWRNILGPTHEISISRAGLDVGTLTATVLDATLDPSESDLVRPGRKVRLTADGESLFSGKVDKADVSYSPRPDLKRARVTLTAFDPNTDLANRTESRGVATLADLPFILEGKGVPWLVNGSSDQVSSASVVATNENASVLDQVAITRDSELGYAWVDRRGVLVANTRDKMPGDSTEVLSNTSFETDVTGWVGENGSTIARSTERASDGAASMTITAPAGQLMAIAQSTLVAVTPGLPFTVSADLYTLIDGADQYVGVEWYDENSVYFDGNYNFGTSVANTWATITETGTVPEAARFARASVFAYLNTGGTMWVDDAHLVTLTPDPIGEDVYSNADISFDTDAAINEVTIKYLRPTGTGETEEIAYGPYRDAESIAEWGARSAEFTVQGLEESEYTMSTYAQEILDTNARPVVRCNRVSIPIRHPEDISPAKALRDLYDLVEVAWDGGAKSSILRVTEIQHQITTTGWTMDLVFDRVGSVAAPTVTPSPQGPSVMAGRLEVGMAMQWPSSTPPEGWLLMDGSQFDGNTYPALAALLGSSFGAVSGSLHRLPLRNDVPEDVALTTSGVLASTASGWSLAAAEGERVGNMVHLYLNIERTGSTLSFASFDHANQLICTLSSKWRPRRRAYAGVGNGIRSVMIEEDGSVSFTAGIKDTSPAASEITQGRTWQVGLSYIAEDPSGGRLYWIIKAA